MNTKIVQMHSSTQGPLLPGCQAPGKSGRSPPDKQLARAREIEIKTGQQTVQDKEAGLGGRGEGGRGCKRRLFNRQECPGRGQIATLQCA